MFFKSNGLELLHASNSTAAAALTAGVTTSLATYARRMEGAMGMWFSVFGAGSNNQTATYKLFGVNDVYPPGGGRGRASSHYRQLLATGTATLSSALTGDGTIAAASNLWADTITATLDGFMTSLETAYALGNITARSPADDANRAIVFVPFLPFDVFELEVVPGTCTSVNALLGSILLPQK